MKKAFKKNRRIVLRTKADIANRKITRAKKMTRSLEWSVQAFVNKHSLMGTHGKDDDAKTPVDPIPLTAEFKPVHTKPYGNIDDNASKAELIKAQMEKYKAEQESKDLSGKIDWLKKTDQQKKQIAEAEQAADAKAKDEAAQNLLKIMADCAMLPAFKVLPVKAATPEPEPAPPSKPKKAKIATGRRFR